MPVFILQISLYSQISNLHIAWTSQPGLLRYCTLNFDILAGLPGHFSRGDSCLR